MSAAMYPSVSIFLDGVELTKRVIDWIEICFLIIARFLRNIDC